MKIKQYTTQMKAFFQDNIIAIIVAILSILFISAAVIRIILPETQTGESWQGITPGKSSLKTVQQELGESINTTETPQGTRYDYTSPQGPVPHEVFTRDDQTVELVIRRIDPSDPQYLDSFIEEYGQPDASAYHRERSLSTKLYVYFDVGIGVLAGKNSGFIEEVWYFSPMSREQFIERWGAYLTNKPPNDHFFIP